MTDQLLSQLTASALVVYTLQALKKAAWMPWLTDRTHTLNRLVSALGAALTAVGIHLSFDSTTGTFMATGLTLTALGHGLWEWINQFALNQLLFDGVIMPKKEIPK